MGTMSQHTVVNGCKLVAVFLLWLGKWHQWPAEAATVLAKQLAQAGRNIPEGGSIWPSK